MKARLLVVDDERDEGELLCELLGTYGHDASFASNGDAALSALDDGEYDVVITDVRMAGMSGIDLCGRVRAKHPDVPVIVVTGQADVDTAIAALRAGAWDFVTKPLDAERVEHALGRAIAHRRTRTEVRGLRKALAASRPIEGIIGESNAIRAITALVTRISDGDATVLITGESGTGKELVARAVHNLGPRKDEPFVAVNCGAVPANLLESELFGHVKGAFTDARRDRPGLFVQGGAGTIFLDEIGEMPLDMQVKLLRVLQERRVRPVGGDEEHAFAARVVCATNRDLETEVEEGRFREDLFHRINVVSIQVPPLRARTGDVLLLANAFLERAANRKQTFIRSISRRASQLLVDYDWPGNVRELENCIERAVALSRANEIDVDDLPAKVVQHKSTRIELSTSSPGQLLTLDEMQHRYVRQVLAAVGGNKTQAALILGIDRRSIYRRLEPPKVAAEP